MTTKVVVEPLFQSNRRMGRDHVCGTLEPKNKPDEDACIVSDRTSKVDPGANRKKVSAKSKNIESSDLEMYRMYEA